MTRYQLFRSIQDMCKMEKTGEYQYNKMIQSGNIEAHDYGTGYFDLCIYYMKSEYHNKEKPHIVRVWIGSIDDESCGSWNYFDTKEKAIIHLEKLVEFFKEVIKFPKLDDLNLQLREIGTYIMFE